MVYICTLPIKPFYISNNYLASWKQPNHSLQSGILFIHSFVLSLSLSLPPANDWSIRNIASMKSKYMVKANLNILMNWISICRVKKSGHILNASMQCMMAFRCFCHFKVDGPICFLMGDAGWFCPLLRQINITHNNPSHQNIPVQIKKKTNKKKNYENRLEPFQNSTTPRRLIKLPMYPTVY